MSQRGVWQLQKLVVSYCDWGGSSRGIRAFMESHLPGFKSSNPQFEVVTELVRGQHPLLKGFYSRIISLFLLPTARSLLFQIFVTLNRSPNDYMSDRAVGNCLVSDFENKNERVVCVRNMDSEEVLMHATRLRNSLGRKVVKLKTRHITKHPSVQDTWTTALKF